MAHFSSAIVTKAGIDLALGAAAGVQSIEFVKMVSGNGEYTEEEKGRDALRERSGLKSQMQEFPFNSVEITSEKTAVLKSIITNKELTDGYRITEIGVYARAKGTEGDGVLYSIALAIESDYLPPFVNPAEIIQEYYITVSDTAEISIVSNPGAYALAEDLEKLREDIESTGLLGEENGGGTGGGEGDSTSIIGTMQKDISDLKSPVFEMAENRGNIESGETTSIIFGKIKKWFTDLKEAAFATIVNHCLATEPGTVLDGRVGKDLQEQIDELKEADEAINSNISVIPEFIMDESGKITGYKTEAGADTVFPFNNAVKIINLGTGTSFNVSSQKGYQNFTKDNFFVIPESFGNFSIADTQMGGGSANTTGISLPINKSYNAQTGQFTCSAQLNLSFYVRYSNGSGGSFGKNASVTCRVYLAY